MDDADDRIGWNAQSYLGTAATVPNLAASATDTQTGFYTVGAGKVDVTSQGVQIGEFNGGGFNVLTGSVGLGTSSAASKLSVNGGVSVGTTYSGANVAPTGGLIVQGSVGIGTTSPASKLDVYGGIDISGVNGISYPSDFTSNASIAIGRGALASQTAGSATTGNIAIGYSALGSSGLTTLGSNSTAVGYNALTANTGGYDNTAFGYNALLRNTTGTFNTGIGYGAVPRVTTGINETGVGYGALASTTGNNNAGVGVNAGGNISSGGQNTAFGTYAMSAGVANITGSNNAAFGYLTLRLLQGAAANNSVLGAFSGQAITTGSNNTALGYQSGNGLTTGSSNTIMGYNVASTTLTTETSNILISVGSGSVAGGADIPSAGTNNFLDIGNVIFATGMTGTISSPAGSVGIGTASPYSSLDLHSKTDALALPVGTTGQEPISSLNGMIRYNTTLTDIEAYIGGYWTTLTPGSGGTSNNYLGTSAVVPNPAASATDSQTGLYTAGTGKVDVTSQGTQVVDISSSGMNVVAGIVGIGTTSIPTGPKLGVNGSVQVAGTGTEPCTNSTVGQMRFNASGGYMEICTLDH